VKKARLIFSTPNQNPPQTTSPYPGSYTDKETGLTLVNHANVFSRDHLDPGSRLLISQIPKITSAKTVVHLGYKEKLNRLFGHCSAVIKNQKFVVLQSIKRG